MWLLVCAGCLSRPHPGTTAADCWSSPVAIAAPFDTTNDAAQPWQSDDLAQLWYGVAWGAGDDDVYYTSSNGSTWSTPSAAGFDNGMLQDDPFIDTARMTMWFSTNLATGTTSEIWEMVQMAGTTTQFGMQSVHTELGQRASGPMGPALTSNALTIYFSDHGTSISRATRGSVGDPVFGAPERLAYPHDVDSPSCTSDYVTRCAR
jgi:hypothetical protein